MKPAFALNLTPEGISLLHRTSRGWLVVGAVALDDPDMTAAMGYLRKTALGLAPQGFATKLILPASQILYTSVEAPGPDAANRRRQIARALEGRTPYAAEDLVFDWSGTGGRVNVAVVARETLDEAEAFAQEHRFNAVSFVAMPEEGAFAGEPFFGQTAKARSYIPDGERLVRDQDPVRIAGDADLSRLTAASLAETVAEEDADAEQAAEALVGADLNPEAGNIGAEPASPAAEELAELAPDEWPVTDEPLPEALWPDVEAEVSGPELAAAGEADSTPQAPFVPEPEAPADLAPGAEGPAEQTEEQPAAGFEFTADLPREAVEPEAEAREPATVQDEDAPGEALAGREDPAPAPLSDDQARSERRRARAERRNREAAELAAAEAAAALARQASFGFAEQTPAEPVAAVGQPGAEDEAPKPEATIPPATPDGADKSDDASGAAPAPVSGTVDDEASADAAAPETVVAEAVLADDPVADAVPDEAAEAPFVAVEDEPEEEQPVAGPPRPALDADGVPTPFAAAATLSPAAPLAGPRLRAGSAEPAAGGPAPYGPVKPRAGDAGSVISPRLGIAAEPRHESRSEPAKVRARASGLGKAVIAAGKMAKAAKTARTATRRVEAAPSGDVHRTRTTTTETEAEALTVFGARRAAPVRGKPRHLGLILTLVLVFLMLAVALWSSLPDGTPTAEAPIEAEPLADATTRTTAVDALAGDAAPDGMAFEDVPSPDAIDADAMTEAEIAADGGFEAMDAPDAVGEDDAGLLADAPADDPVDLPVDVPEDLPPEMSGSAADVRDLANAADALAEEEPAPPTGTEAAPDAAAAAAIEATGAGAVDGLANGLAAADVATAAPTAPAEVPGGPQPDATEGLPPRPADPAVTERSAETLPETGALTADALPEPPQPPLPYGTDFQFDADGLIVATPDGALTPDGVVVVAGTPALVPPPRPAVAVDAAAEAAGEAVGGAAAEPATQAAPGADEAAPVADPALAGFRPQPRPASLEVPEPAVPATETPADAPGDGAALIAPLAADPALAGFRPRAVSTVAVAAASAAQSAEEARAAELEALQAELASATASAVASSRKPASRPQDFSQGIEAALAMAATSAPVAAPAPPPAPVAQPAPVPAAAAPTRQAAAEPEELDEPEPVAAAPNIPTTASVARQATISGALSLREINLIGVYGASSSRRALVRLANGRMLRVQIGDRIDGGRVTTIGEGQLTYVKGGRTHVLRMIQQS